MLHKLHIEHFGLAVVSHQKVGTRWGLLLKPFGCLSWRTLNEPLSYCVFSLHLQEACTNATSKGCENYHKHYPFSNVFNDNAWITYRFVVSVCIWILRHLILQVQYKYCQILLWIYSISITYALQKLITFYKLTKAVNEAKQIKTLYVKETCIKYMQHFMSPQGVSRHLTSWLLPITSA